MSSIALAPEQAASPPMAALGYSINTLTLLALVLAVGIVVDDAIVVLENVERYLHEGMSAKDAARKTMDEIGGALISIALVLAAVFVPTMFLDGITGQFFRQFAVATVISAFNSLTLSPALAGLLLRTHNGHPTAKASVLSRMVRPLVDGFNRFFDAMSEAYGKPARRVVGGAAGMLLVYVVLVGLAAKNAILIVEFARDLELEGESIVDAVVHACRLRLRPILMTSLAFILGVVPLLLAKGAGAELRHAIGATVFFGILGVTAFGLIFTPVFYVIIRKLAIFLEQRKAPKQVHVEAAK